MPILTATAVAFLFKLWTVVMFPWFPSYFAVKDSYPYPCDRNLSLGINLGSLSKILKCAGNDDIMTLRAEDSGDNVTFVFESPSNDRISEYEFEVDGY